MSYSATMLCQKPTPAGPRLAGGADAVDGKSTTAKSGLAGILHANHAAAKGQAIVEGKPHPPTDGAFRPRQGSVRAIWTLGSTDMGAEAPVLWRKRHKLFDGRSPIYWA